jgi:hypothetical protein
VLHVYWNPSTVHQNREISIDLVKRSNQVESHPCICHSAHQSVFTLIEGSTHLDQFVLVILDRALVPKVQSKLTLK